VTCVSDLNVRLSTWCHFVQPKRCQSRIRQFAHVNSQRLQPEHYTIIVQSYPKDVRRIPFFHVQQKLIG